MRLPWVQVTQEAFGLSRSLAGLLGCDRHRALSLLIDLWAWGLDQGPADEPPQGMIINPRAARMLAGAVEWAGDADELLQALEDLGAVEILDGGVRVRGMRRYHGTWRKNRAGSGGNPNGSSTGTVTEPKRQTQKQKQKQRSPDGDLPPSPHEGGGDGSEDPEVQVVATFIADLPPTPGTLGVLADAWNEITTAPLPRVVEMPPARRKQAQAALRRRSLAEWRRVFEAVEASSFCRGADGGWRAGFDWAIRAGGVKPEPSIGLLEGVYARAGPAASRDLRRGAVRAEDMAQAHRELPVGVVEDW